MAYINHKRTNPTPFIHQFFLKEAYLKTYSCMIHHISDQALWHEVECNKLLPSIQKCMPKRPKLKRRRQLDEEIKEKGSSAIKCGLCKGLGHNKRSYNHASSNRKELKQCKYSYYILSS